MFGVNIRIDSEYFYSYSMLDFHSLVEKYEPLAKRHWLPISLGSLGLIFFVYGLIVLFVPSEQNNGIVFEAGNETDNKLEAKTTIVDVAGAVMNPGVYRLNADARAQDALVAAGGLSLAADRSWVARVMNLAARVQDGAKIYIPTKEESTTLLRQGLAGQAGIKGGEGIVLGDTVNINTAEQAELEGLSGVGSVIAKKIIDNRPYGSIEDLLEKKAVGKSVFEKIKGKISVY